MALACLDTDGASPLLARAGYERQFAQRDIPNSPLKRLFQHSFHPLHSIVYCARPGSVAIELTEHGHQFHEAPSRFQVLFASPPAGALPAPLDSRWAEALREAAGAREPQRGVWPELAAEFWFDGAGAPGRPAIHAVLVPVSDLERACRFWVDGLGTQVERRGVLSTGEGWLRTGVRALFPQWSLRLVLVESRAPQVTSYLDSRGFPCLAFLTTQMEEDTQRLVGRGARGATGTFRVTVNGAQLGVQVVRGPDGELVELLERQPGPQGGGRS